MDRLVHSDLLTLKGHNDEVSSVAFSADGKRVAQSPLWLGKGTASISKFSFISRSKAATRLCSVAALQKLRSSGRISPCASLKVSLSRPNASRLPMPPANCRPARTGQRRAQDGK